VTGILGSLRQRRASCDIHDWDERVAREAGRQARIETAFDRADAFYSSDDFESALEWLRTAEALAGDLPPAYRLRRAQMAAR
jgi:hypothetical protein